MEKIPKEKIIVIPEVDTDVVSDLAPFNFTVERDKLLIDDSYAVPYVITKYNNKPRGNWFNRIRKMSGDITISHYYTKANGRSNLGRLSESLFPTNVYRVIFFRG